MASVNRQRKSASITLLSVQMSKLQAFQAYCHAQDAAEAAEYIRRTCDVQSRAEFDRDPAAADRFHGLVRRPFVYGAGA